MSSWKPKIWVKTRRYYNETVIFEFISKSSSDRMKYNRMPWSIKTSLPFPWVSLTPPPPPPPSSLAPNVVAVQNLVESIFIFVQASRINVLYKSNRHIYLLLWNIRIEHWWYNNRKTRNIRWKIATSTRPFSIMLGNVLATFGVFSNFLRIEQPLATFACTSNFWGFTAFWARRGPARHQLTI